MLFATCVLFFCLRFFLQHPILDQNHRKINATEAKIVWLNLVRRLYFLLAFSLIQNTIELRLVMMKQLFDQLE